MINVLSAWTDLEESVAVEVTDRRKSSRLLFSLRCEEYIGKQKGVVLGLCKSKELILVKRSKEGNRWSFFVLHYERGNWSREYLVSPSVNGKFRMTHLCSNNSTLRYECDETFSDECEFAARAEGDRCNHTCQENVFSHEYRTKFYITWCENVDFRTRSVRKTTFTHSE